MFRKTKNLRALKKALTQARRCGKKVVFTNGCFDILHAGHTRYLQKARSLGDLLVIGLNADKSVKKLKGPSRPVNDEKARAEVLSALSCVDHVVLFSEDTPLELIRSVRPDVLVKGGDWKKEHIVGADVVGSYGGRVLTIPFVKDFSTTGILRKIERL